jgi:hypothetical protein
MGFKVMSHPCGCDWCKQSAKEWYEFSQKESQAQAQEQIEIKYEDSWLEWAWDASIIETKGEDTLQSLRQNKTEELQDLADGC